MRNEDVFKMMITLANAKRHSCMFCEANCKIEDIRDQRLIGTCQRCGKVNKFEKPKAYMQHLGRRAYAEVKGLNPHIVGKK